MPFPAAGVQVDLPLPAWVLPGDELYAVQYELATGVWTALDAVLEVAGPGGESLARVSPLGPGTVAVIKPDADPRPAPPCPLPAMRSPGASPPNRSPISMPI